MSRQQKNSSSSEKQGSGTSPSDKMGIIRAEEGAQYIPIIQSECLWSEKP